MSKLTKEQRDSILTIFKAELRKIRPLKEIKVKIEALETALRFPALPNNNAILQEVLKDTLLALQADLINELEATKGGTQFAVRDCRGKAIRQG